MMFKCRARVVDSGPRLIGRLLFWTVDYDVNAGPAVQCARTYYIWLTLFMLLIHILLN